MTDSVLLGRVLTDDGDRTGYGFDEQTWDGVRVVGHNGGYPGTHNEVDLYPSDGYVAVVLGNLDGIGTRAVIQTLRELLTRR